MAPVLPAPGSRAPPALPDHLLEDIFVRIGDPAELARASAACKAFRRLIADTNFLRRYRSLHPPLFLGFIYTFSGFHPADAPHPNAPVACAFAGAADFTFGQLPARGQCGWSYCDARGGRVLMLTSAEEAIVLPEMAVCDPLTQGYMLLPPIPDDLLTSIPVQFMDENMEYFDAFFDPSESYEQAHFRVICWTRNGTMGAIFIYSSISSTWTHGASIGWDELGLDLDVELPEDGIFLPDQWASYAYGCLYWKEFVSSKLVKLNISNMEFSAVSLPARYEERDIAVVEAGEGRIGIFSLVNGLENPQPLRYSIRQTESENPDENQVETTIPLPNEYDLYSYHGAVEGYIFLIGSRRDLGLRPACFSLEIKTMKVERVSSTHSMPLHLIPYFGFPPFMSPRRI